MNRKAQSAIEYLITYGWMLIAVAIVSTAVYSAIGFQCVESTSGFTGSSIGISDTGSGDMRFDLLIENREFQSVETTQINFTEASSSQSISYRKEKSINAQSSKVFNFQRAEEEECNTYEVEIQFDRGSLTDRVETGRVTVRGDLTEVEGPDLNSFSATY